MKIILYLFWWSEVLGDSNQQNYEIMIMQKTYAGRHGSNFYGEGVILAFLILSLWSQNNTRTTPHMVCVKRLNLLKVFF